MNALFVDRSFEIEASPMRVWDVLTKPELTAKWAKEFGASGHIESDWSPGYRPVSGRAKHEITQSYFLKGGPERTTLTSRHGDFANLANGEKLFPLVGQLWDKLLPLFKELAEG